MLPTDAATPPLAPGATATTDATATPDAMTTPDTIATPDAMTTPDTIATPDAMTTPDTMTSPDATVTPDAVDVPLRVLGPDGRRRDGELADALDDALRDALAGVTLADLCDWYRDMVLTRRFDAEATALQRQGELALWVPSIGQEATQVGSARALRAQDHTFPGYRDHGVLQVRGVPLADLLPLFRGTTHGGWDPERYRCHLYTLVVGSQALHATGYAMGVARDGLVGTGDPERDAAVSVYFGDGATSQGDVNEALVFASAMRAPVVFVCVNNGWAISEPVTRQSPVPLAHRGPGFGIPSRRVDGNDVLACYAATRAALDAARAGGGPAFLELVTYRMGAHTTSDDPSRYRSADDEAAWAALDPITRLRRHLSDEGVPDSFFAEAEQECDQFARDVRSRCRSIPDGTLADHFDHVYATRHRVAERDRAAVLRGSTGGAGPSTGLTTGPATGQTAGQVATPGGPQ